MQFENHLVTSSKFNAYIDGFNLYKGALAKRPHLRWLDIISFSKSLRANLQLGDVYYFTARVAERYRGDDAPRRQERYLRVLANQGVTVVYGKFRKNESWMRLSPNLTPTSLEPPMPSHAGLTKRAMDISNRRAAPNVPQARVQKFEEKGSDVNLASYLLRDAFTGLRNALVISGDSDLVVPIQLVVRAGVDVKVLVPNREIQCSSLRRSASSLIQLHPNVLEEHQLPEAFITKSGRLITRPKTWT